MTAPDSHPVNTSADDELGTDAEVPVMSLPPPPKGLAGESKQEGRGFTAKVSNADGYLARVEVESVYPGLTPADVFAVFTHPDNSALFRDIKEVADRVVLKAEPGYVEVQVQQCSEVHILWMRRTFRTWLHVKEDSRNPDHLTTTFLLQKSDVLSRFNGHWDLYSIKDPATGKVTGCRGVLTQEVLPKGMPIFMAKLPILGGALRGASLRAVVRVMEDIDKAMAKVREGHAAGRTTDQVLRELGCGARKSGVLAHAGEGAVQSFALDASDTMDEDDNGDGEEAVAELLVSLRLVARQASAGGGGDGVRVEMAVLQQQVPAAAEVVA